MYSDLQPSPFRPSVELDQLLTPVVNAVSTVVVIFQSSAGAVPTEQEVPSTTVFGDLAAALKGQLAGT